MSEAPPIHDDIHPIFRLSSAIPRRLIHLLPDELAAAVPNHTLFSFPKTPNPQDGFVDVSAKAFANAINRTGWHLLSLLGTPRSFDSVCYIGPNDIRYFLFMFAAIKVGYKMLFLSPRNNLEAHLNVLEGADCQIFLSDKNTRVEHITSRREMRTSIVPELNDLLDESPVEKYPYNKTFEEARMDPCLVLHTTGSTGLPKPIVWKLGILSTYEAWRTIPHVDGYVPTTEIYQQSRRAYTSMPLFHTSGLNAGITWSLLLGVTLVYGAPYVLPNAQYTDEMHKYAGVDASMGAPSIYEELSRDAESLERLNRLCYVVASGAPLAQQTGALLSKHTRVISNLGATETACLQRLAPAIDDWAYFYWHPTHSGIEMREHTDGMYELFIVRDPKLDLYQGVFYTFPEIQEWSMNDLYERHPDSSKPFLWRYKGRKDDVIVLTNGEKIAPALIETTLASDPLVKGAMLVGQDRFQPAALIDLAVEPPENPEERRKLIQVLQPVSIEANKHAPGHGKLDESHILFADPEKPIKYLGQGKIQRRLTYQLYKKEIEQLYRDADEASEQLRLHRLPKLDFDSKENITGWLKRLISEIADIKEISTDQDLFEAGIDSLQVRKMARELKIQGKRAGLEQHQADQIFSAAAIYQNPKLAQLVEFISHQPLMNGQYSDESDNQSNYNVNDAVNDKQPKTSADQNLQEVLKTWSGSLPHLKRTPPLLPTNNMVVVLTGSTGSLGSYLLESLYHNSNVKKIICLNRSANAKERHNESGPKRGLTTDLDSDRIQFLKADLSKSCLGLKESDYKCILRTTTHIIHNQWPVNFNWTISSFEPYIRGVRNLIDLSISSAHSSFILFVSSVSAVGAWKHQYHVPEKPIDDLSAASMGYGQSKLIAENLLDKAAAISGVRSACCRVGIVAGPVGKSAGMWNQHEYIPSIIISSAYLGIFPADFPSRDRVDWLPVDKLSGILVKIATISAADPSYDLDRTQMYHVVNPNITSWSAIVPYILASYPKSANIKAVPFHKWLEALDQSSEKSDDVEKNPALKLLEFYRGAESGKGRPRMLKSERNGQVHKTLDDVGAVNQHWINNWMQQWGYAMGDAGMAHVSA